MIKPLNGEDDFPEETPEALRGIAERLQHAIDELISVRAEAEEYSVSAKLSEDAERAISAADQSHIHRPSNSDRANLDRRLYLPDQVVRNQRSL